MCKWRAKKEAIAAASSQALTLGSKEGKLSIVKVFFGKEAAPGGSKVLIES